MEERGGWRGLTGAAKGLAPPLLLGWAVLVGGVWLGLGVGGGWIGRGRVVGRVGVGDWVRWWIGVGMRERHVREMADGGKRHGDGGTWRGGVIRGSYLFIYLFIRPRRGQPFPSQIQRTCS